jgi:glyoxylase-like metal-dependent hydrolase (beta-lactamase superfamily II)
VTLFDRVGPSLDLDLAFGVGGVVGERGEAAIQRHRVDEHTWLLRQSLRVSYEAPIMYLLFGAHTALLLDTGATKDPVLFPLRATVDELVAGWLNSHPRDGYRLVVAHTHAHGDHVAADGQFAGRPDTTVIGTDVAAVRDFFGLAQWPAGEAVLDLGERALTVFPVPGHHRAHIAVHDPWTGFLLTGDTVYPGRLYVEDMPAYAESLDRLVTYAEGHPVSHVMGAHIEMSRRAGRDFPIGSRRRRRDEAPLPMTVEALSRVRDAAHTAAPQPGVHRHDGFAIWNGPCRWPALAQSARTLLGSLGRA